MTRISKLVLAVAFSVAFAGSAGAQSMGYRFGGYPSRADPQVNIWLSQRYDHLLQVSPGFRHYRMRRECRPITWPGLRAACIASFDQYEPLLVADYGYHPWWGHHWRRHHWRHYWR